MGSVLAQTFNAFFYIIVIFFIHFYTFMYGHCLYCVLLFLRASFWFLGTERKKKSILPIIPCLAMLNVILHGLCIEEVVHDCIWLLPLMGVCEGRVHLWGGCRQDRSFYPIIIFLMLYTSHMKFTPRVRSL